MQHDTEAYAHRDRAGGVYYVAVTLPKRHFVNQIEGARRPAERALFAEFTI